MAENQWVSWVITSYIWPDKLTIRAYNSYTLPTINRFWVGQLKFYLQGYCKTSISFITGFRINLL